MSPLALLLAAIIGASLGLLGGGGSILTVPAFVYLLGYDTTSAIAMSLPVVGLTALAGALPHWRRGDVRWGTALVFGGIAMPGAWAGARLARHVPDGAQLLLLALLLLAAGGAMLRDGSRHASRHAAGRAHGPDRGSSALRHLLVAATAAVVGVLTGLVGIGGGFLIVPALVLLVRVPMRQAIGTSLLVIAMNAAAGFAGYLGEARFDPAFLVPFTAVAVAGALAGSMAAGRVPQAALRRAFAVALLAIGGFVLHGTRDTFTSGPSPRAASAPERTR